MPTTKRYRCLACSSEWTRVLGEKANTGPACPNGCEKDARREVLVCEYDGAEWTRPVTRGKDLPKACDEHRGASGNRLVKVSCAVCGEETTKRRSQVQAYRSVCSDVCRSILTHGYRFPSREDFERATRKAAPAPLPPGIRKYATDHDRTASLAWAEARAEWHGDCLLWKQGLRPDGYPAGDRPEGPIHRLLFMGYHGKIPTGDHVHHTCANRACVAPAHLALSTARENVGEMLARRAYEARLSEWEAIGRAVLDGEDVVARILSALGGLP